MEAGNVGSPWRALLERLRPDRPPPNMRLYVRPAHSCAEAVVRELLADPESCPKFLLVGARGGGKSTELRAISEQLKSHMALADIDLDQSGVQATAVSAYDLLYISAVALLRLLPADNGTAKKLFDELALRYAGGDERERAKLGNLAEALGGIASFAGVTTAAAAAAGLVTGMAPVVGAFAAAMGQGLKRVHQKGTLPGSKEAAVLFANGRILAYPPVPPSRKPRWVVHPLLLPDVEQAEADGVP